MKSISWAAFSKKTRYKSLSGIPGLAQIPFFHYFFGETKKERKNNELVFAMMPHIVRAQEIRERNVRAIDVGTANTISLHRNNPPAQDQQQQPNPAQPRGAMQPGSQQQPQANVQPTSASLDQSAASAPAGSAIVSFDPPLLNQAVGTTFTVNVNLAGGQNVYSVPLQIMYNPRRLASGERLQWNPAVAGRPACRAGTS